MLVLGLGLKAKFSGLGLGLGQLKNKSLALALPAKALFNNVALLPQRQIQNKRSTQIIFMHLILSIK